MEEIKRVFFHEFGHFVAREINNRFYNGPEVIEIVITPFPFRPGLFEGDTRIKTSDDAKEKYVPTKDILPEYLASSSYGCFFQSYYMHAGLKDCFNANGMDDQQKWSNSLFHNGFEGYAPKVSEEEYEFFNYLTEKKLLDDFMMLNPDKYLIGNEDLSYHVDLNLLRGDTNNLIETHKEIYKILIDRYHKVLNSYDQEK
jgi:hypothetical protein